MIEINKMFIVGIIICILSFGLFFTMGYYYSYTKNVDLCNQFIDKNYAKPIKEYYNQGFNHGIDYAQPKDINFSFG